MNADRSAERVALNDATFRNANEGIEEKATQLDVDPTPFICECADESCTELIQLSLSAYEEIRSQPTHFLNVPGHEVTAGPHGTVVAEREGYVIVQKLGVAADIVADLDERSGAAERRGPKTPLSCHPRLSPIGRQRLSLAAVDRFGRAQETFVNSLPGVRSLPVEPPDAGILWSCCHGHERRAG